MAGNTAYSAVGHGRIIARNLHPSFGVNIDGMTADEITMAGFADDKGSYLLFVGNNVSGYLRLIPQGFWHARRLCNEGAVCIKGKE